MILTFLLKSFELKNIFETNKLLENCLILQAFPRFVDLLTSYSLDNHKYFIGKGVSNIIVSRINSLDDKDLIENAC